MRLLVLQEHVTLNDVEVLHQKLTASDFHDRFSHYGTEPKHFNRIAQVTVSVIQGHPKLRCQNS